MVEHCELLRYTIFLDAPPMQTMCMLFWSHDRISTSHGADPRALKLGNRTDAQREAARLDLNPNQNNAASMRLHCG